MTQLKVSSIPYAKAALVTIFTAALATAGRDSGPIPVLYGVDPKKLENETVMVGSTNQLETQAWAQLGAKNRQEDYSLDVYILVNVAGDSQQEATERAFAILALLETAVRADVHLGLAESFQSIEAQVAQAQLHEEADPDGEGFAAAIPWAVRVTTRM